MPTGAQRRVKVTSGDLFIRSSRRRRGVSVGGALGVAGDAVRHGELQDASWAELARGKRPQTRRARRRVRLEEGPSLRGGVRLPARRGERGGGRPRAPAPRVSSPRGRGRPRRRAPRARGGKRLRPPRVRRVGRDRVPRRVPRAFRGTAHQRARRGGPDRFVQGVRASARDLHGPVRHRAGGPAFAPGRVPVGEARAVRRGRRRR